MVALSGDTIELAEHHSRHGVLFSRQRDGNAVRKLATFGASHTLNFPDVVCSTKCRETTA
jgi:hypothetical protein